jgi:hypothetical protein
MSGIQDIRPCMRPGPLCPPECRATCPDYKMMEELGETLKNMPPPNPLIEASMKEFQANYIKAISDAHEQGMKQGIRLKWPAWIPVSEGMPEHGDEVIFLEKSGYMRCVVYAENDHWRDVTHWTFAPPRPETI